MDFLELLILINMQENSLKDKIQILINNFNIKNYSYVISKIESYIKKYPQYVILYNLLGSSYQNVGKNIEAEKIFIEGLKYDPKNQSIKNNLATTYKNLLQYNKAEKIYSELIKSNPNYINPYVNLGNLKRDTNKFEEALKLYETANNLSPNNLIILYSLASAHQGLGNFDIAIEYANKALSVNPEFTRVDHLISQSMTYTKRNSHFKDMLEKTKNNDLNSEQKVNLYFSLSKACEDMDEIEDSYNFLKIGNDLNKRELKYDVKKDLEFLTTIKKIFKDVDFKKFSSRSQDKIIFVLGMPRSGTSLIEQIVSSHSKVIGGGELPILSKIIKDNFIDSDGLNLDKLSKIIKDPKNLQLIANDYFNFTQYFNIGEKFIIDKAPLNFRWIGFIKILFPNSKIIHCYREPKNNCLSIYKNLFEGGLGFSYNENDLVKFYKAYQDLMKFWKTKDYSSIIDVNYEQLVKNKESEIKKIIKFCQLNWEEECLLFHKNKNPIKTMSTAQARKPIYASSIGKFDKFSDYLKIINNEL